MVWFKKNEESELDDSKEHVRHGSWRDNLKGVWRESEPGQKKCEWPKIFQFVTGSEH